jgi:hypothetical protein
MALGSCVEKISRSADRSSSMTAKVTRAEVRSAYRYLLRSITLAFREDHITLSAAKTEARRRFNEGSQTLKLESAEAEQAVQEVRDTAKFMRVNLVQGVKDEETGRYRMSVSVFADD